MYFWTIKFLIIATLFAAASANSYDPTSTPAYPTPSAKANEAPSTYQPESYVSTFNWIQIIVSCLN